MGTPSPSAVAARGMNQAAWVAEERCLQCVLLQCCRPEVGTLPTVAAAAWSNLTCHAGHSSRALMCHAIDLQQTPLPVLADL